MTGNTTSAGGEVLAGVALGSGAVIENNFFKDCDGTLNAGDRATIIGNSFDACEALRASSVSAGAHSVIVNNTSLGQGFTAGTESVIRGNSVDINDFSFSGAIGIGCFNGRCVIKDNSLAFVDGVGSIGITCGSTDLDPPCLVMGNIATGFSSFGFSDATLRSGYKNNHFSGNNGGNANPQVFGGIELGSNSNICGLNTACP